MRVTKAAAYALHILMYMVRHREELPATASSIAEAEGIPLRDVTQISLQLINGGFVKAGKGRKKGYVLAKPPEEISMLELFETIEGGPLFDDCLLRHCECGGTPENCCIYAKWRSTTNKIEELFEKPVNWEDALKIDEGGDLEIIQTDQDVADQDLEKAFRLATATASPTLQKEDSDE